MNISYITKFTLDDLPQVRAIRVMSFGEFDIIRFTRFFKMNNNFVWVLKDSSEKDKIDGYIILYERGNVEAWIYQLGTTSDINEEGINTLFAKAEEIFSARDHNNIRMLIRDHYNSGIKNVLSNRQWKNIDSIWIMERNMNLEFDKDLPSLPEYIKIVEADPKKHIDGVVHVDRAAFIFGHRVPKGSLMDHLSESGAFIAIDSKTETIVGYNYNTINNSDLGHFIRLAILPDYRRMGIATHLLFHALKWFKNLEVRKIYLRTIPDSAGAHLYKKYGFIHSENESTFEFSIKKLANS